jgi:hypothetical protein
VRVIALFELGVGVIVEHFQDRGEAGGFIEKEMQGIERASVCAGSYFDASVGAGEA